MSKEISNRPSTTGNTCVFDGTEGGFILRNTAHSYIENYQQGPSFTWNQGTKAHFFGKKIIQELLSQHGAVGIRIHYGSKINTNNGKLYPELILVATDCNGNDLLNNIADMSIPCPNSCPIEFI